MINFLVQVRPAVSKKKKKGLVFETSGQNSVEFNAEYSKSGQKLH